jgi:hypothetical protein
MEARQIKQTQSKQTLLSGQQSYAAEAISELREVNPETRFRLPANAGSLGVRLHSRSKLGGSQNPCPHSVGEGSSKEIPVASRKNNLRLWFPKPRVVKSNLQWRGYRERMRFEKTLGATFEKWTKIDPLHRIHLGSFRCHPLRSSILRIPLRRAAVSTISLEGTKGEYRVVAWSESLDGGSRQDAF